MSHVPRTGDGRPLRIFDVFDQRAFRAADLRREFYGPLGVESRVAFTPPVRQPVLLGVTTRSEAAATAWAATGLPR